MIRNGYISFINFTRTTVLVLRNEENNAKGGINIDIMFKSHLSCKFAFTASA